MPDVQIVPQVADFEALAEQIGLGELDLAITYDLGLDATFERVPLRRVQPSAFFAQGDPLAGREAVRLADLVDRPLVLFEEGLSVRHMLSLFAAQGLRPVVAHRATSLEVMRSLAGNGEGIGISYAMPSGDRSYDGARVEPIPIADVEAEEDIVAAFRQDMADAVPIAEVVAVLKCVGAKKG